MDPSEVINGLISECESRLDETREALSPSLPPGLGPALGDLAISTFAPHGTKGSLKKVKQKGLSDLKKRKKAELRRAGNSFLTRCKNEVRKMSRRTNALTAEGNSQQLLVKFNKLQTIKGPDTFYENLHGILTQIQSLDLVWNKDIPALMKPTAKHSVNRNPHKRKQPTPRDAFICYAREDFDTVMSFVTSLKDRGITVWMDTFDLIPGDKWDDKIEVEMEYCDYLLAFISHTSCNKIGFLNKELNMAFDQYSLRPEGTRYIIPIRLDGCDIPRRFKSIHTVDISEDGCVEKVVRAIKE